MFDEPRQDRPSEMVELLEELTLATNSDSQHATPLQDERLSVDLKGTVVPADHSRRAPGEPTCDVRLVRVGPREFTVELGVPLSVSDHYELRFAEDDLRLANPDESTMRCTACGEVDGGYRATLRPFVPIDLRLSLGNNPRS